MAVSAIAASRMPVARSSDLAIPLACFMLQGKVWTTASAKAGHAGTWKARDQADEGPTLSRSDARHVLPRHFLKGKGMADILAAALRRLERLMRAINGRE
ncbi:hypothetical protein [Albidovulum sediminis]|uniref:Uncharacterized protein n=1 Tax=Albidovulum sediminis TaxID=3066345 RepID=A0ABT2NRQ2_9RHOB|nr:hypothetical protein [Defluviimonas sediminis]MCT8330763.1 hypothetical protein [Defluviimonas sediminis]